MRVDNFFLLMAISGVVCSGCSMNHAESVPQQKIKVESDYVLALSAVNTFFDAWRNRDQERGLAALSPRLLKSRPEEDWRAIVCGCSNPHNEAYEVSNGHRLPDGRYAFDVRGYTYYSYFPDANNRTARALTVKVIRLDSEHWQVDDLPSEMP